MDTKLKNTLIKFADFFIMPSIQVGKSVEGFGISFLEAAKYGTASIGGMQGGASDIIKNKKTGFIKMKLPLITKIHPNHLFQKMLLHS